MHRQVMGLHVQELEFRVCGYGSVVWDYNYKYRLCGLGFMVQGLGFRVQGIWFVVQSI